MQRPWSLNGVLYLPYEHDNEGLIDAVNEALGPHGLIFEQSGVEQVGADVYRLNKLHEHRPEQPEAT